MTFKHMSRNAGFATVLLLVAICSSRAADSRGVVEGVVKNSSGQPVAGAFVKLKNAERRLTFMVISQAQGRYTADQLPPGKYTAQGVGNGLQSEWSAPVDVAAGKTAKLDLSLAAQQAPALRAAWPGMIPEEDAASMSFPEGEGKQLVSARCVACHAASQVTRARADRETWQRTLSAMQDHMKAANIPELNDEESKVVMNYLVTNFPPLPKADPNSRLPRTLMQGEATKYKVVQYELENTKAETHDVAVDPEGVGWSNQRTGGKLSRFDPETLEYSEVSPPLTKAERARMGNLQISSSGVVWLPDGSAERRWLSYEIKAGKWTSYDFPATMRGGSGGNSMAIAPNGIIWNSGPGAARSLNPVTKEWNSFDSPTWLNTKRNPGGYGIAVAGDGKVWFAENQADLMARVDPGTGKVEEFKIPVKGKAYPRRMATDAEGNIWVGLWSAGKLMKIDSKTAEMTTYDPPTPFAGAYAVSVDKKNNLVWVTLHRVDKLARFNPKTKQWVEFPLPQSETDVRRIEVDQHNPNRVWWSSVGNFGGQARMGYIEVLDGAASR